MKQFLLLLFLIFSVACKQKETSVVPKAIEMVEIENVLEDSLLSIRAIEILNDGNLAFAANNNSFGLYNSMTDTWSISTQKQDSLKINFRAISHTNNDFFMLSVGKPALLYKTTNTGMKLVYQENHQNVFYDAMDFWNDQEGIAIGDPTKDCMSIIITRDGGNTWAKISCDKLPNAKKGEAAFAASNTNIAIIGNHTWVATGGNASRVLYSPDKGNTWEVYDTPIVQGIGTTGIYSIDFYDDLNGFAIGGDYTKPEVNSANKMRTKDGGKTWHLVGVNQEPGYRSCVQYIPNREGNELVAVGFNGIDYSKDSGTTWKHLSDEGFYTIRFLNDSVAYAAGKGRISKLAFK